MTESGLAGAVQARFGVTPRPAQLALIRRTLEGQSSLGVMPTGSGKSLSFQGAAALMEGTVLVVSPLLSLMRDQVEKLHTRLRAARLDASLEREEAATVLRRLAGGDLDLLYVAPERLANERFLDALRAAQRGGGGRPGDGGPRIAAVAIDEAHCISAWGHDFRPDYLRLPILLEQLGHPPVLALTATAPPAVRRDIMADLRIPPEGLVDTGARRPNLALSVEVPEHREARLLALLREHPGAPTIVYALRQADTEALAGRLQGAGLRAAAYHAGMEAPDRSAVQDAFLQGDLDCTVATVAFGMGVDKPDVRRVVHVHAPRSLEAYVQEVGRAGRDGEPATGTLLFSPADLPPLANFVEGKAPDAEQVRHALNLAFARPNRESADVIAFSPQTVGDEADVDPLAVRTLFARLERRGVVQALTPAFDEYQVGLQHDAPAVGAALGEDAPVWEALLGAGKRGRTWVTVGVGAAVASSGIPYPTLRRVLRRVEEEGLAPIRASGALQRYRVLRPPDRATDLPALLHAVEEGLQGDRRRLEAVQRYVLERRCRQAHLLDYLGEPESERCGVCDLCTGGPPVLPAGVQAPDWRGDFDPQTVRALATLGRDGPDPVGVARALCRVTSTRSRPYRRHPAWGQLARAPYAEVLAAVRQTLL
ncbi:MAG TPA: RecQ family ATP-dependent DNA helicase [Chloroflexota bacterium]|nr:RecQ family ATP-dependent DNA helicase [Chloroflexota bacterium]